MSEKKIHRTEFGAKPEQTNTSFENVRDSIQEVLGKIFADVDRLRSEGVAIFEGELRGRLVELGESPESVQIAIAKIEGIGGNATVEVSEAGSSSSIRAGKKSSGPLGKYSLALTAVLLSGCGDTRSGDLREKVFPKQNKVLASGPHELGDKYFDPNAEPTPVLEVEDAQSTDCGVKPENAPPECGIQQWKGYSEINPAATAWMAISNTGDEPCTATITRLELSYTDSDGKRQLLTSGINWAQMLSENKVNDGGWWGKETSIPISGSGSRYDIPPGLNAYVHPFSQMVYVPEDATELTMTFSAEITDGCIMQGGMDTYSEYIIPQEGYKKGYTQDGSTTDFIKEALKTKYYERTVEPTEPVSISIHRVPVDSPEYGKYLEKRNKIVPVEGVKNAPKPESVEALPQPGPIDFLRSYFNRLQESSSNAYNTDAFEVYATDKDGNVVDLGVEQLQEAVNTFESVGETLFHDRNECVLSFSNHNRKFGFENLSFILKGKAYEDYVIELYGKQVLER